MLQVKQSEKTRFKNCKKLTKDWKIFKTCKKLKNYQRLTNIELLQANKELLPPKLMESKSVNVMKRPSQELRRESSPGIDFTKLNFGRKEFGKLLYLNFGLSATQKT
jgi:hypothetical protein